MVPPARRPPPRPRRNRSPSPGGTTAPASRSRVSGRRWPTDFEAAHPNVTIEVTAVQNEELQKTKIPAALQVNNPPDLFQQWGGGETRRPGRRRQGAWTSADKVARRTRADRWLRRRLAGRRQDVRPAVQPRDRGLLVQQGPVQQAGITATPTTLADLNDAVDQAQGRRASPRSPWAPRTSGRPRTTGTTSRCATAATAVLQKAGMRQEVRPTPCFTKAGDDLKSFLDHRAVPGGLPRHAGAAGRDELGRPAGERQGRHGAHGSLGPRRHGGPHRGHEGARRRPRLVPVPVGRRWRGRRRRRARRRRRLLLLRTRLRRSASTCSSTSRASRCRPPFAETGAGLPVTKGAETGVTDPNMKALLDGPQQRQLRSALARRRLRQQRRRRAQRRRRQHLRRPGIAEDIVTAMNDAAAQQYDRPLEQSDGGPSTVGRRPSPAAPVARPAAAPATGPSASGRRRDSGASGSRSRCSPARPSSSTWCSCWCRSASRSTTASTSGTASSRSTDFVGLDNYMRALTDPVFLRRDRAQPVLRRRLDRWFRGRSRIGVALLLNRRMRGPRVPRCWSSSRTCCPRSSPASSGC